MTDKSVKPSALALLPFLENMNLMSKSFFALACATLTFVTIGAPVEWTFPRTGCCHEGIPFSDGVTGVLVWGGGDTINLTVGRADLWDHRGGYPWTDEQSYTNIVAAVESGDTKRLLGLFRKETPKGEPCNPYMLPLGRVVVKLQGGATLARGELDPFTGFGKLILSDGNLSSDSGTTEQQAMNTVSATSIPVYAIGITGDSAASYSVENARHMLKMAEVSLGGIGLIPAQVNISAADAAQQVWENIQESAVMKINLASVTSTSNNATVRAKYELGDTRLEDSISVDLTMLAVSSSADTAASIEQTAESVDLNTAPQNSIVGWIQEHLILIVSCAAAAVVIIVVIIVIVRSSTRKKREQARMEMESKATDGISPMRESESGVDTIFSTSDLNNPSDGLGPTQCVSQGHSSTAPVVSAEGITVQMIVKSHQDVSVSFTLVPHKQQILGRDDRADIIINADDYQLSGKHCLVEWDGNYLYIQDMGSTNGTVLNGISLKPDAWSRLNSGSILHMGSFDYQVAFQK